MEVRERRVYCSDSIPSILIYNYVSKPDQNLDPVSAINPARTFRIVSGGNLCLLPY